MKQRQHFCPHCDDTFSLGSALTEHMQTEHPLPPANATPAEMGYQLGSSTECGYYDDGEY